MKGRRFFPVARGPVPRDLHRQVMFLGSTDLKRTRDVFSLARTMARDRPSPYGNARRFFPVARGPVPRERWIARTRAMARDRPSPYDEGRAFCRRGLGRRGALLHRDAGRLSYGCASFRVGGTSLSRYAHRDGEVSPTGKALIYETPSINRQLDTNHHEVGHLPLHLRRFASS